MRSPKWLVVSTAIVSSICLILILCSQSDSLLFSIALAIFGSSVVGLIMSLIQYYSTKRECLERFYLSALCILKEFTRIRPYEDEWKDDDFNHVCKTFVEVSNTSIDDLGNAYGTLDFFVNKNLRNKICYEIYVKFNKYIKDLFHKSYSFSSYLDGKLDNHIARIRYKRFSDEWFYKKNGEEIEDDFISYIIYNKICDELSDQLEELRAEIYREKIAPLRHYPIRMGIQTKTE